MLRRAVPAKAGIVRWVLGALAAVAFFPSLTSAQVTFSVGTGGTHSTIQAAVNACPPTGCVINLTDSVYRLPREIWIEGKTHLTIQAAPNLQLAGIKPRLLFSVNNNFDVKGTAADPQDTAGTRPVGWKKWPSSCKDEPGGAKNTTNPNPNSTSGFQHNGMVVVYKSTDIHIEGVKLDGKAPQYFVNNGIWDCKWDVLFGNVGFNLFQSKSVVLRNNEMTGFFASIYMQNRNVGGAFAAPNPDDLDVKSIVPYSAFGRVGDHLIEKNYIHNNWWGIYNEMEWDIGSTIRYNILDSNFNTRFATSNDSTSEANNMAGGFMYVKDVMIVPHKIYNNTMNGGVLVLGHGGFKPGIQHYFYNNLLTGWYRKDPKLAPMLKDYRQLLSKYKDFLFNNTFELGVDSAFQVQPLTSDQIPDSSACAAAGQVGQKSCYLPLDSKVNLYTGIQLGKALWDGWNVAQGGYYTAYYNANPYRIYNNQVVDVFGTNSSGIIQKAQGVGNTQLDISKQANYWARKIKYKSIKPGTAGYMEPSWGDPTVDTTVLDKGWVAAGNRDQDGTMPDRGAIPKAKGALISPLTLKDQSIVKMTDGSSAGTKKVSFSYCLDGAGSWSNLQFEMKNYYNQVGRRSIDPATGNDKDPWIEFSTPVAMTPTSAAPVANECNTFTAEVAAPVDSFARFELIVKGDLNGQSVRSNVGVWIWRKTQYILDVYFTKPGAAEKVKSVRVGEKVDMHVRGLRTDNGSIISTIDVLAATPNRNTFLAASDKQIAPGDTIAKPMTGEGVFPVYFTQTGTVTITMSGKVGSLPVPGEGSITVRPGLPETVEWQSPADYKFVDRTLPLDSVAAVIPQAPTVVKLQVKDKWGNDVDTIANINLTSDVLGAYPLLISDLSFAATANGPFTGGPAGPWTFVSDVTGAVNITAMVKGVEGQKFWGIANVVGKPVLDSAIMKVGKQLERLYFTPIVPIDTFVTVKQPVHIILSEDGKTVKATSTWGTAVVKLRSALGSSFYASATSATPIDSIALVSGEAYVWVTSNTPVINDTLYSYNLLLGNGMPASYTPVSFRMPPTPPAPTLTAAGFIDVNCDGYADSIDVTLSDSLKAAVNIDSIYVAYSGADKWVKTGWRILPGSNRVRMPLPFASTVRGNLTGNIVFAYKVARPPVLDTTYWTPVLAIADKIGPALVDTAYLVENFSRPTQEDTLKVRFTEPVSLMASAGWVFTAVNAAGTVVAPTTLVVKSATPNPTDPTRYTITFDGNTAGALVAQGYKLRLTPSATIADLADLAGNAPAGAECAPGVPVVEVPSPIPVRKVWLKDVTGDGAADRLYIQYAKPSSRSIKATDMPAAVALTWGSTLDVASATSGFLISNADSTIWELPIGPMAKGVTVGYDAGRGLVVFAGGGRVGESAPVEDSVSPIPVKASVRYAADGDYLTVTYSEPVKTVDIAGNYMVWKSGVSADQPVNAIDIPTTTDNVSWVFKMASGSATNPNPGDSVRLPLVSSRIVSFNNGTQPSITDASPYVVVLGGDRPPAAAWYLDTNADGIVDALGMQFAVPLKTSPAFVFKLGAESRTIDATNGLVIAPNGLFATVSFAANPFTVIKTSVDAADNGTMTSTMGDVVATASFPIRDSVDPVIISASLRYASYSDADQMADTLKLAISEPVAVLGDNIAWGLSPVTQHQLIHLPGFTQVSPTEIWVKFDSTMERVGNGDSVRLAPIDAGGQVIDANGNAPTYLLAKWTRIVAGQRPPRFAVDIFPSPLMVVDPITHPDVNGMAAGPQMSVYVTSTKTPGVLLPMVGDVVGTTPISEAMVAGNAIGPRFTVNGPFEATAIVYDNLGVFVGQIAFQMTQTMIDNGTFAAKDGSFEVVILWNGQNLKKLPVGSGIYMFRVVVYRDQEDELGNKERAMVMNQVTKVGVKIKTK